MKALTISQPYASLIALPDDNDDAKRVENRTWDTRYRGPLLIHAGKGTQYLDRNELREYPTGCVVAVADLRDCVQVAAMSISGAGYRIASVVVGEAIARRWPWLRVHKHTEGPWCWVLQEVRALPQPVPCSGALGLWVPPADVVAAVKEQLATFV